MTTAPRDQLPLLTVDLDGVICAPQFGLNLGLHRSFLDPDAPPPRAFVPPRWLSRPFDRVRFDMRRPLPGVAAALADLRELRRVVMLTGRRSSPRRWLRRHGLEALLDDVVVNATALSSAHFKLAVVEDLGAAEHIDDDGRTVQLLAERSAAKPFVRDWPRNRGLPYHERVERVADLGALVGRLAEGEAEPR
jgi:hypothetical protein